MGLLRKRSSGDPLQDIRDALFPLDAEAGEGVKGSQEGITIGVKLLFRLLDVVVVDDSVAAAVAVAVAVVVVAAAAVVVVVVEDYGLDAGCGEAEGRSVRE